MHIFYCVRMGAFMPAGQMTCSAGSMHIMKDAGQNIRAAAGLFASYMQRHLKRKKKRRNENINSRSCAAHSGFLSFVQGRTTRIQEH